MRVQGALIWNISPLMSSAEPPIMYSTSLWSIPYEAGAPTRLLYAQERAFLRDLRTAIDKQVEHKIASARRFAVSYFALIDVIFYSLTCLQRGILFSCNACRYECAIMLKW